MTTLPDLLPGFAAHRLPAWTGEIFARVGGSGPPLLLLHGYPETHVMWHRVAPRLAEHFTVVVADLVGYGASSAPPTDDDHTPYSKRGMGGAMAEAMTALGHDTFAVAGHDRGARVAYRMALDLPGRVTRLAVLDAVTTYDVWHRMTPALARRMWHWGFLAEPAPFPETVMEATGDWLAVWMSRGSRQGETRVFDPGAVEHYRASLTREGLRATAEDYRAGATTDLAHDAADLEAGRKIACPVLALWGERGNPASGPDPLGLWRQWAGDVRGEALATGHFLAEEDPEATLARLLPFFRGELTPRR